MPSKLTAEARAAGCKTNAERADTKAAHLAPVIAELQAAGKKSLRAIAAELNERRIPTPRGDGEWQAVQVRRVLGRLPAST